MCGRLLPTFLHCILLAFVRVTGGSHFFVVPIFSYVVACEVSKYLDGHAVDQENCHIYNSFYDHSLGCHITGHTNCFVLFVNIHSQDR